MKQKAMDFATKAHEGQLRKYTGEPYIYHVISVASKLEGLGFHESIICAALLHDTVEDTSVIIQDIEENFGVQIARMVEDLTDVYTHEAFPNTKRRERKILESYRLSQVGGNSKSIKLADIIDNIPSIIEHGKDFSGVFLLEVSELLRCLDGGDLRLMNEAVRIVKMEELKLKSLNK